MRCVESPRRSCRRWFSALTSIKEWCFSSSWAVSTSVPRRGPGPLADPRFAGAFIFSVPELVGGAQQVSERGEGRVAESKHSPLGEQVFHKLVFMIELLCEAHYGFLLHSAPCSAGSEFLVDIA